MILPPLIFGARINKKWQFRSAMARLACTFIMRNREPYCGFINTYRHYSGFKYLVPCRPLNKAVAILLLTILLLQAGGILLVYKMQQYAVTREMQQSLNERKTCFQKITLSFFDYQKSKINAREICISGKMYDIKSINISEGIVVLLVIHDSKEENIISKIKKFAGRANQPGSDLPTKLQQLLSMCYLTPHSCSMFFIPSFSINHFPFSRLNLVTNDSEINTPPPQLV